MVISGLQGFQEGYINLRQHWSQWSRRCHGSQTDGGGADASPTYINKLEPEPGSAHWNRRTGSLRTTDHRRPTGFPKQGTRLSRSQSDRFLALSQHLPRKNLPASSYWWRLLTALGWRLPDSIPCLLKSTLENFIVP